ncbi:MAG: hypothetical protein ACRDKJ_00815 [Actinomycetota bacterium]
MRRSALALAFVLTMLAPSPTATAEATSVGTLRSGRSVFWNGAYVARAEVADAQMCGSAGPCFDYRLGLVGTASRLRVAIDTPSREDTFKFVLLDPDGSEVASATNDNQFNAEAFVDRPRAGVWTVRVLPTHVTEASFRMRARLEGAETSERRARVALLPNLRSIPPYELGFIAPANPFNGVYPPDTVNPPLDVFGVHPFSCAIDEMAEDEVERCLRLTAGPMNAGAGPFEMRFRHIDDVLAGAPPTIFQAVHYTDGRVRIRKGGTYSFHRTHAHYHYDDILTYELFRVSGDRLVGAGKGNKSGFCPADQLFADWHSFGQVPPGSYGEGDSAGGNCFSPSNGLIGLSVGWGDVYRWQRPGQYVDFGSNGDGRYVVRATVDKANHVLESDEADNSSYALIHVVGDSVRILERGRGSSHLDDTRIVYRGAGPASLR